MVFADEIGSAMKILSRNLKRLICSAFILLAPALGACKVTDSNVQTTLISPPPSINSFILVGDNAYFGQLASAMGKQGFMLRPAARGASVRDSRKIDMEYTYTEAGDRYGIQLSLIPGRMVCSWNDARFYRATLTLIDIQQNSTCLVLEVEGPDKACAPLSPVWDLLAIELRQHIPK
jgi:hypothetical protein